MTQIYGDAGRETDPHALPDVEVFYSDVDPESDEFTGSTELGLRGYGWYWWPCFPGCLPDGDPTGPFDTEDEAIADARSDR